MPKRPNPAHGHDATRLWAGFRTVITDYLSFAMRFQEARDLWVPSWTPENAAIEQNNQDKGSYRVELEKEKHLTLRNIGFMQLFAMLGKCLKVRALVTEFIPSFGKRV